MFVRYGLVMFKRMELLVPSAVLTVRLPGGILRGIKNRIVPSVQEVNEVIASGPIRTELFPREEPKLPPLTVTTVLLLAVCGEMLLIQGSVPPISRRFVSDVPFEVVTRTSPLGALSGTRTTIRRSDQLT